MRWGLIALVAVAILAALPAQAGAQGAVAFTSMRCDDGGVDAPGSTPHGLCTRSIFVVGDDGVGVRRLTTGASPGDPHRSGDFGPSWSEDGQRIVFARQTGESYGLFRLFTMRANGSDARRLLQESPFNDESSASWSPRGDAIAFTGRMPDGFLSSLYAVAPDGSGLRRITPQGWEARSPAFTPDGRSIAFFGGKREFGGPTPSDWGVWLTDAQGSAPVKLTVGDIPMASNATSFSPSGEYLAVTLVDGSLYSVRTDGSELTRLTSGWGLDPDWAGTDDTIFYVAGRSIFETTIMRLGFPRAVGPVAISAPGSGDQSPDWSLPGRVTSALPVLDDLPPVAVVGDVLANPPADVASSGRRVAKVAAAQFGGSKTSKIPFIAMDRSGIRSIAASAGLRVKGGCRFLMPSRKLTPRRACSKPLYLKVKHGDGWRTQTRKLPAGKYEVRFRTTDVEGNATKRPKARLVRVK